MLENIKIGVCAAVTVPVDPAGTLILPANKRRLFAIIQNGSDTDIWILFGTQGAVAEGILIPKSGFSYEIDRMNLWQGEVYAIHAAVTAKDIQTLDCS